MTKPKDIFLYMTHCFDLEAVIYEVYIAADALTIKSSNEGIILGVNPDCLPASYRLDIESCDPEENGLKGQSLPLSPGETVLVDRKRCITASLWSNDTAVEMVIMTFEPEK